MRYQPAHAVKSGSVPFMLRGPKSVRTALSAAVAGAIAFAPAVLLTSPAQAVVAANDLTAPPASAAEGTPVTFNITSASTGDVWVSTADDATAADAAHKATATNGADQDYTPITRQKVTFGTGAAATQAVPVTTTADTLYENDESFALQVYDASSGGNLLKTFVGTITNDDTAPTFSMSANPNPANDGTDNKTTITAQLDKVSGLDSVVTLSTADGTAKSPADYQALPNNTTVTIPAGQRTITKDISIVKDEIQDSASPETFTVNGTATNVANTAQQQITVSITDGDTAPVITLTGGGSGPEGSTIDFIVSLNHGSEKPVTVDWSAAGKAPNAATPGTDFTYPTSRTVTIPANTTQAKISIATLKDNLSEGDEDFTVSLSNAGNATLGATTSGTGTITNGNDAPTVTVEPTTVIEGNTGRKAQTFTAKLSAASSQTVRVNWKTAPTDVGLGYAVAGKDYVDANGTLTFAPGVTTQTFTVDIIGDTIDEGSGATPTPTDGEKVDLLLSALPNDSTIDLGVNPKRTVTIIDDDATPTLVFADRSMMEGNDTTAAVLPVSLSNASDRPLSFTLTDTTSANNGTADDDEITFNGFTIPGGNDYQLFNTAISIPAEATSGYGVLLINGDTVYETDETAYFTATADNSSVPYLGAPTTKTAKLTLQNDDKAPDFEINSATANEGDTVTVTGTYTGQSQIPPSVAVSFAGGSSNGSKAASADDFVNPGVTATNIPAWTLSGSSVKVTDLKINTDTTAEPAETIIVKGVGLNNSATVTEGIITIAANGATQPEPSDDTITLMSAASFRLGAGSLRLSGMAPASANLTLWGKAIGSDDDAAWENLGTTTANATGAYSFSPEFTTTGWWFKVSNGDIESDTIKVNLKEDPDFAVRSSSKGKVTLSVIGDPKVRGLSVRVLRANTDGTWTTVGTGLLNASGAYTKTINGTSGKSYLFKATVYGDGDAGLLTNTSKSARVTVR
ncbi:Calx-beta domain-containing protein [Actinoplanes sp. TFC3]|uniref:beta strand repeat-containing protein n=1 Tax=Actinoplanes sp. TFC3 TaxID=1710355 RepID=UPI00082AE4FE|nr:Calx-beta domain-containing protein [Actinoplanes sp. TFC3]